MNRPWETEEFFKRRDEARKRFPMPSKTNADRIRSMTDEELALFLSDHEFALFGMWAKPNFILEFLQSDDWDGFMRSAEKGWEEYTTSPVEVDDEPR